MIRCDERTVNMVNGNAYARAMSSCVTVPPTVVEMNTTNTGEGVIKMSCLVESFPSPNITWTLERDLTRTIMDNGTDGMLSFSHRDLGNHRHEYALSIRLSEWLGESRVRCTATTRFGAASDDQELNKSKGLQHLINYLLIEYSNAPDDKSECPVLHLICSL